jgi:hypothetical protein
MNIVDFQNALFAVGRDRDEEVSRRDLLIVKMRLDRRAHNFCEADIDDEIGRAVDGTGDIGRRSRRVNELELKVRDLHSSRYMDALTDRGLLLAD